MSKLVTLKDVTFFYSSVSHAIKQLNKDNKPPMSDHPLELHGYEIKIALPESRFKELKREFRKAKNLPNAREYSPEEYVRKLLPGAEEPEEDMYLIKFTQSCMAGKKKMRQPSRPLVQIGVKGGVQDRNGKTIKFETQIGNGTKGHFQFNPVETQHGLYLYPTALCITELVEYLGLDGYDSNSFGIEELDEIEPSNEMKEPEGNKDDAHWDDDVPF